MASAGPSNGVTLATGPLDGRYRPLSISLAREIEKELGVKVDLLDPTKGSLHNLSLLAEGKADFTLYQPRTLEALKHAQSMEPMFKMFDSSTLEQNHDQDPETCGWIRARLPTIYQNPKEYGVPCQKTQRTPKFSRK